MECNNVWWKFLLPEDYMRQADAWVVYTGTCR